MLLAGLLLVLAAGDATPPTTLAAAPGAPPAASIVLGGHTITLDKQGRANVPPDTTLSAPGMRIYRPAEDGPAFYFSANDTLVTWPLSGIDQASGAKIVVKDHGATSWEHSITFEAPVESKQDKARVRFVLAPGEWDLAILVPGYAPAFAQKVAAREPTVTTSALALKRAGRVKARILSARTGKPPERWLAWVSRNSAPVDDEETRFFATRPISADRAALDFTSLPVGGWQLLVEVPGGGKRRQPFTALKPGGITDLGDFVILDLGSVRLTLEFPVELPRGDITVRLKGISNKTRGLDIDLGSKTVRPKAQTVVELGQIEPGFVMIECEAATSGIRRTEMVTVNPGETAEDRFVFVPVRVHGAVKRGDEVVPGAIVGSGLGGSVRAISTTSDATSGDFGEYALKVWVSSDHITLMTLPPGDQMHFVESVPVESGASEVEHDVILPVAEIHGIVRDAESGAPISDADVRVSTSAEKPGEPSEQGFFHWGVTTDHEGRFRLRNLGSRRVDVRVEHKGYAPSQFMEIEVTPEGKELDVRLDRGLRFHGMVTDESDAPLSGVIVGLDPDSRGLDFSRTSATSGAGEFEFRGTATGSHVLEILECGFTMEVRGVDVRPREETPGEAEENVQLGPELEILHVHLEDDAGTPLNGWTLQWTINGVIVPHGGWQQYAEGCGQAIATDTEGNLLLHGAPRGTIGAVASGSARSLGSFRNDGSQNAWTIRIPKE